MEDVGADALVRVTSTQQFSRRQPVHRDAVEVGDRRLARPAWHGGGNGEPAPDQFPADGTRGTPKTAVPAPREYLDGDQADVHRSQLQLDN